MGDDKYVNDQTSPMTGHACSASDLFDCRRVVDLASFISLVGLVVVLTVIFGFYTLLYIRMDGRRVRFQTHSAGRRVKSAAGSRDRLSSFDDTSGSGDYTATGQSSADECDPPSALTCSIDLNDDDEP